MFKMSQILETTRDVICERALRKTQFFSWILILSYHRSKNLKNPSMKSFHDIHLSKQEEKDNKRLIIIETEGTCISEHIIVYVYRPHHKSLMLRIFVIEDFWHFYYSTTLICLSSPFYICFSRIAKDEKYFLHKL
jgi:hypothetical protein